MVLEQIDAITRYDREVGEIIRREYTRMQDGLELIASENFVSPEWRKNSSPSLRSHNDTKTYLSMHA